MRGVTTFIGVLVGLFATGVSTEAWAAEWYVDAAAGGGGNGSMGSPFGSLQDGLDAAMPGDDVHVAAGTYGPIQSVRGGSDGARITIVASDPRQVIVEASGTAFEIKHSHHTVEGVVFDCGYGGGDCIEGGGSDAFELIDVEVRRAGRDCIDLRNSDGVLVEASHIHHCVAPYDPNNNADSHGITGDSVFGLTVRDTTIRLVTGDAIQLSPSRSPWDELVVESSVLAAEPLEDAVNGWAAGTVIGENAFDSKVGDGQPSVVFRDVVAYGWRGPISNAAAFNVKEDVDFVADGVRVYDSEIAFRLRGPASVRVHNTVLFGVDIGARFEDGLPEPQIYNVTMGRDVERAFTEAGGGTNNPDLRNILFLADAVPDLAAGESSNMATDASVFVDADADDYHLMQGSAPMDAGIDIPEVLHDFDGVARPVGNAFDVGAYEWTDAPPEGETGTTTSDSDGGSSSNGDSGPGSSDGDDSAGSSGDSDAATSGSGDSGGSGTHGAGSSGAGLGDNGSTGCTCRAGPRAPSPALALIVLVVLGGRRPRRYAP